jgi:hypothetical protein
MGCDDKTAYSEYSIEMPNLKVLYVDGTYTNNIIDC